MTTAKDSLNSKIRVLVYLQTASNGGVIHHFVNLIRHMDKERFEFFYCTINPAGSYHQVLVDLVGASHTLVTSIAPEHDYQSSTNTYGPPPADHPLFHFIAQHQIDILIGQRAGIPEFPFNKRIPGCKIISTNIFAGHDSSGIVDWEILISLGVANKWKGQAGAEQAKSSILPLMQAEPHTDLDMRAELNISPDVFVVGRIGNVYAGDSVNMKAYAGLEKEFGDKVCCVWLNPSADHLTMANQLGIRNIHFLPSTNDYVIKSKIINTFDVFAHDRGETFGAAVAECIFHKKPVITTQDWTLEPYYDNAQVEFFPDATYCGGQYDEKLKNLYLAGKDSWVAEGLRMYDFNHANLCIETNVPKFARLFEQLVRA